MKGLGEGERVEVIDSNLLSWETPLLTTGNKSLRFSNFETPILKYLKNVAYYLTDVQTEREILLHLLLLKTHSEPSIFVLLNFLLLKEGKTHMQLPPVPHSYSCWWLSRMIAAELERGFVKMVDLKFGIFRLPRGLSRRTRHCRSMAGVQHGMCEIARHGMRGAQPGRCMGTEWYVWFSLKTI